MKYEMYMQHVVRNVYAIRHLKCIHNTEYKSSKLSIPPNLVRQMNMRLMSDVGEFPTESIVSSNRGLESKT